MKNYRNGIFLQVILKSWTATIKCNKNSQDTIKDKSTLSKLKKIRNNVKNYVNHNSLYFDIDNLYLIQKRQVPKFINFLEREKEKYIKISNNFIDNEYDKLIEDFKQHHPDLYDNSKYPTKEELRKKFQFRWKLRRVDADTTLKDIDTCIYKKELENFEKEVYNLKKEVETIVVKTSLERMLYLKNICLDGKLSLKTTKSINNFLKKYYNLYIDFFDNDELKLLVKKIRSMMKRIKLENFEDIKKDSSFLEKVIKRCDLIIKGVKKIELTL